MKYRIEYEFLITLEKPIRRRRIRCVFLSHIIEAYGLIQAFTLAKKTAETEGWMLNSVSEIEEAKP